MCARLWVYKGETMKVRVDYGDEGGPITIERGKKFEIVRIVDGVEYSVRSGTILLPDGTEHEAILEFCDYDSGEHNGTAVWSDKGLVWQGEGMSESLGKTKDDVYPYKYRYHGYIRNDHHTDAQY